METIHLVQSMKKITLTVNVCRAREALVRRTIGLALIRLATRIMGCHLKVFDYGSNKRRS